MVVELDVEKVPGNNEVEEKLLEIMKKQIGSENVTFCVESGSKTGENFMGQIFRIKYKQSDESKWPTSLILKLAPKDRIAADEVRLRLMFLREIFMYQYVFPFFDEFLLYKGIDLTENGFNERAKCYGSISAELSEALFLEDLRLRQFEVVNIRNDPLTFEHVSLSMKALGKFHALSFALKDQQSDNFNKLKNQFTEQYWTFHQSEYNVHFNIMIDRFRICLEEEERFDLCEKLEKVIGHDSMAKIFALVSGKAAEPYSVICHGDLTTNNSMCRNDENGKAIEIQLLDWQFSRYASPITDVVLYLLCSTTKELRDNHFDEFLKIYYESLSNLLRKLGSDPMKLFPYEALLEQFQQFGEYAVFVGMVLLPVIFADRNTFPDPNVSFCELDQTKVFVISDKFKKQYNRIVVDLVDDMVHYGYME